MDSTDPKRGEVWLVAFGAARSGEPGKHRPAIVVSADELTSGGRLDLFVVVPLSSSLTPSATRPPLAIEAVDAPSVAVCRAIRGMARSRFVRVLGATSPEDLAAVEDAAGVVLGLVR